MLLDYILRLKTTTLWKVVKLVAFLKGPFVMQDDSLSLFFAYGTQIPASPLVEWNGPEFCPTVQRIDLLLGVEPS